MTQLHQLLQAVDAGTYAVNNYPLPGIITQCDEWITEGWQADNDNITGPMYAAALLNEAATQDSDVQQGTSHPEYPKTLRILAFKILEWTGHGNLKQTEFILK